jgi:predicted dehydrogenase/threonine dehydrogenase-like Zn-dependent dehydrogenase
MRQVLLNSQGALVARMPRPALEPGCLLVRVHYSMISTGTELAGLRGEPGSPHGDTPSMPRVAAKYLGKALRDPRRALERLKSIARHALSASAPRRSATTAAAVAVHGLSWTQGAAQQFSATQGALKLVTDASEFGYQASSQPIPVAPGTTPVVELEGEVRGGVVSIGLIDETGTRWIGSRNFDSGALQDRLIFDAAGSGEVTLVIANGGSRTQAEVRLDSVRVLMMPPTEDGLPLSELADQGWNVGYSVCGEVIAVGEGVVDMAIGDLVAGAGAGKANHADFVSIPRNLACRVPRDCDLKSAATTTVGTIALQGVRRAAPQLGESVAVLGLGLIGQISAQLLRANGTRVIGLDPDPLRVAKARELGMDAGESDPEAFKLAVRDFTGGRFADRVLITAATKSDAVINLAMEVARPRATVVIVGDIGMSIKREAFYRKELDLLMSTSYGPGRYDRDYEEGGRDYPFSHVRWTLNRNMQAYMSLIAAGRLNVGPLIERVIPITEAPEAYRELARAAGSAPLGVLLSYPEEARKLPEPPDAPRITVRGFRTAPSGVLRYALVGAGAFGTSMLVPQLARRKDRFFLRGVVSRNSATAGNFARAHQVEILATDLDAVLADPEIDLVVIATRHHEHADQVVRALEAGKHVFVEKPLAITWEQLDRVSTAYERLHSKPLLMVGFNRRFSPAMQALHAALKERRGPLMVNYRLNGGYIPLENWVQGPQGGGRNIGEACHMYDCFRFLAGAPVEAIQAAAIDPGELPYLRNDNFSAALRYADGSVGSLVYTAMGPKSGLPKERVEVFCDGEAYVLDDYTSLLRASDNRALWGPATADKGHFEELCRFGDAIAAGEAAPIPFGELMETSAAALRVESLLVGDAA